MRMFAASRCGIAIIVDFFQILFACSHECLSIFTFSFLLTAFAFFFCILELLINAHQVEHVDLSFSQSLVEY